MAKRGNRGNSDNDGLLVSNAIQVGNGIIVKIVFFSRQILLSVKLKEDWNTSGHLHA